MSGSDQSEAGGRSRPPRTKRRRLFSFRRVLLLLLLLAIGTGYGLERLRTHRYVNGTGHVMTGQVVKVRAAVEGLIEHVSVDSGAAVDAGQLLVQLNDDLQRAAREELLSRIKAEEAELQRLETNQHLQRAQRAAQINRSELNMQLAQQHLDRLEAGSATVARMEIEEAQVRVEMAASRLEELRLPRDDLMRKEMEVIQEQIAAMRKRMPVLEAELSLRQVRSPLKGTVYFHGFAPGEIVKPSDELGQVFDRDSWIVALKIPERQIVHVREGQTARVSLAAYPSFRHGTLEATIRRKDGLVTPQATGDSIFYIEAVLTPRPDIQLQPGLTAWARIDCGETTWLRRLIGW